MPDCGLTIVDCGESHDNPQSTIHNARPSNAPAIRALLVEAFAESLLPFTVYRAPQSVARLAQIAEEGRIRIVGDLEGVAITTGFHLDYLAVARSARGKGLGRLLIDDFHANVTATVLPLGGGQGGGGFVHREPTTLDVLGDNPARRWYESLGYVAQSESLNLRLALKTGGNPPDHWKAALTDERRDGFAAVEHDGMRLGLLGGTALRLLDAGGLPVEEALARIPDSGRQELILMGADGVPSGYRVIEAMRTVRMRRG